MRRGIVFVVLFVALAAMTCGGVKNTGSCTPGESRACSGPSQCAGFQVCNDTGTFDPCNCGTPEAGVDVSVPDVGQNDVVTTSDSSDVIAVQDSSDGPGCTTSTPPPLKTTYVSNPTATMTTTSSGYTLHKELNAFANYGVADAKADIVYKGETAQWTFSIPSTPPIQSAILVASMDGCDCSWVDAGQYSYKIWADSCEYDDPVGLPRGAPFDAQFTNWTEVSVPASLLAGSTFTVTISDVSPSLQTTDWIAVDWLELRVTKQ